MNTSTILDSLFASNDIPLESFDYLTPNQMHQLLRNPLGNKSLLKFHVTIDNETLDQIPLFRVAEHLLKIIQREKQLKLTAKGALTQKIVVELYEQRFIISHEVEAGYFKNNLEEYHPSTTAVRVVLPFTGLAKKINNKLSLTKNGEKLLLPQNRVELFKVFFEKFTSKLNWGYFDRYSSISGQLGWAYSTYLLAKYGNEPQISAFYAEKYIAAFPMMLRDFTQSFSTPQKSLTSCYAIRTLSRFWDWFGFVNITQQKKYSDALCGEFTKSDLFEKIFFLEI